VAAVGYCEVAAFPLGGAKCGGRGQQMIIKAFMTPERGS
jgi:hypothetical protein